jgi:type I restriction enzyme S subunit
MTSNRTPTATGDALPPPQNLAGELRQYPEYKESKLPWLEKIPKHWTEKRSKYIFREVEERSITGSELHLAMSQKLGLVPHSEIKEHRLQSESYAGAKLCSVNDIVMNRLKAHLGVFAIVRQPGIVSPDYTVFRPQQSIDPEYYEYLLKSYVFRPELFRRAKGIIEGFWRLYTDDFYDIRQPVPPFHEQQKIARFLRHFDRYVNRYIRAKWHLIDQLNEQKQVIINRAITHGIDPNVQHKPSGIEGFGDIPEHWEIKPLKRWVDINKYVLPENTEPDYSFKYLDIGSVGTGYLIKSPENIRFANAPSRARRILRTGDTIISTVRTYLKAIYFVDCNEYNLVASTGFAVLTPKEKIFPEYLSYLIQSSVFVDCVTANSVGIAYPAIAETKIGTFHIAVPPTQKEQKRILNEIKSKVASIDLIIRQNQKEIDLIREFRTCLISDVVTGKLDVRNVEIVDDAPVVVDDIDELDDNVDDNDDDDVDGDDRDDGK